MKELRYLHKNNLSKYLQKYYPFNLATLFDRRIKTADLQFLLLNKIIYCTYADRNNAFKTEQNSDMCLPDKKNRKIINRLIKKSPVTIIYPVGKLEEGNQYATNSAIKDLRNAQEADERIKIFT